MNRMFYMFLLLGMISCSSKDKATIDSHHTDSVHGDSGYSNDTDEPHVIVGPIDVEMALIPAGTFLMGSPEDEIGRYDNESPHSVTLTNDYWISSHEITQAQVEQVLGYRVFDFGGSGCTDCAGGLTWVYAAAFTVAISEYEGYTPCYSCTEECFIPSQAAGCVCEEIVGYNYDCEGYRLPTEAEWEHAGRAGSTASFPNGGNLSDEDQLGYYCDDKVVLDNKTLLGDMAWYCGNSAIDEGPQVISQLDANEWGLHDVIGNLPEICHDRYTEWSTEPQTNPVGTSDDVIPTYVVKGGGYWYSPQDMRLANRGSVSVTPTIPVGLRLTRSAN